eukprot:Protomagalhaensia_wolfi_Nauph_80__5711@NODE_681_length_2126_cov_5491_486344_g508_i0_p2_GENE_NODE_681_length_2126_cov_5491_486344_g508_i0NODE_681_length_2126_cov_5491_486344_g508_i0_p2_ORF_typecomplete_len129_score32_27C2/PF00168_30/2_6e08_NODE_681_length_2126_cov_5491_486344_g508_i0155541
MAHKGPVFGSGEFSQVRITILNVTDIPESVGAGDVTSPYVTVTVGDGCQRTATFKGAGANACFNEDLTFVYNPGNYITIAVYHEDGYCFGSGTMPLESTISGHQGTISIHHPEEGFVTGNVEVQILGS